MQETKDVSAEPEQTVMPGWLAVVIIVLGLALAITGTIMSGGLG